MKDFLFFEIPNEDFVCFCVMFGLVIFLTIIYLTAILYCRLGWFKFLFHDVMGWHVPGGEETFDGYQFHAVCKYCGKEIMQDSQGNWF